MIGLGTLVNTGSAIVAGLAGNLIGKLFKPEQQDSLIKACGISVLFLGIAGAMEGMLTADGAAIKSGNSMMIVICIVLGTLIGELLHIERGFENFGEWLKRKTGNAADKNFVNAFVSATFTVCIGAMTIVGSIQDGMMGDPTTLYIKSILDFIIIAIISSTLGKGALFSAIPILVIEGGITLLAGLIAPVMTETALAFLSMVGSILIFCVGLNLVFGKGIRVANMLPAVVLAVAAAFIR